MTFKHSEETDDIIRRGYEAERPARLIAEELGTTRNSVIGRAHRLGVRSLRRKADPKYVGEKISQAWARDPERRRAHSQFMRLLWAKRKAGMGQ